MLCKENLMSAFKMIDKDGSGMISVDELKQAFDSTGDKKEEKLWLQIMEEVDKNKDGEISLEEFMDTMTSMVAHPWLIFNYQNTILLLLLY